MLHGYLRGAWVFSLEDQVMAKKKNDKRNMTDEQLWQLLDDTNAQFALHPDVKSVLVKLPDGVKTITPADEKRIEELEQERIDFGAEMRLLKHWRQ
jgi:hypothetical protein